jgi:two-component system, cell cycle sensor histidine kinase and response regulator CckA
MKLQVLIAEDESAHAEAIRRALSKADGAFEIRVAGTLREFRELAAARPPDIALLDLNLPDGRAVEVLISPPEAGPFPVVIMTSYGSEQAAVEAMKSGALDYLVKSPESFSAIQRTVERALREWRLLQEKQEAEEALLKSESKYRRLFESMMDSFVSVDMSGRITEFNQAYEALLGYSKEELLRLTYVDLTPDRWQDLERDLVDNQILVRGYSDIYEKEYRKKDGTWFPVEMRTFLIRDSSGRPEGMWAIVRDISERKKVEEALRKTEEKYSLAFRASPDWSAITTLDEGVFIEVNKAFERLSGFGPEEVLGRSAVEIGIWEKPEERLRLVDLMHRQGAVRNMEVRFRLRSGAIATFLLSAEKIELEGKSCILTVARDMTEFRSLEAQFRQAQKMEAVGRLAGGVAHDFNNMLGVILGYTGLALKRLNAQEPLYHDLQEVNDAARRSADLTRQLLAFSRKQFVTPRVINLNDTVLQQQKMLGRLIGEDIALKFIPGQDLWNIRMDSSQVDQILANLAVNARDAVAGVGTVTIETANVTLDESYVQRYRYASPGDYVLLAVSDSGSGMDGETLERIYEPFFTTKGEGQGTGLGLSTVYGIVKQNGGSIQGYSEPGLGTTFKIYFPRFLGEGVPVEAVQETPLSGSETVLIVEDEPQILLLAKRILEHYGYRTVEAGSPGEALLFLEKHRGPLHLLLTDVIMPNMTGPELKERVELLHPGVKTLFMSGYTADVIVQRGLLEEGPDFIQKPFSLQDLARKVRRVLDS